MNGKLLEKQLERWGFAPHLYNLRDKGPVDNRICCNQINNKWFVFYGESGEKINETEFETESDACIEVLKRLVESFIDSTIGDIKLNRKTLKDKLDMLIILPQYYNIEDKGDTHDKTCCRLLNNKWTVYYSERGMKFDVLEFDTEDGACREVLRRLLKYRKPLTW